MANPPANDPWSAVTPPVPTEAALNLGAPQTQVSELLLKGNVPSVVYLTGPTDLLFSAATLTVMAKPLVRNLADPQWGATRSTLQNPANTIEFLLPGLVRIDTAGLHNPGSAQASGKLLYKDSGGFSALTATPQSIAAGGKWSAAVAFQTDVVRVESATPTLGVLLRSPSLPSRVAIAVGDDTPVQVFPSEMAENGTVTTRELAANLNMAWRRNASGASVTVALKLTSMTDGVVSVELKGAWGRAFTSPELSLALNPFQAASAATPWPALAEGAAVVTVTGRLQGGRRLGLAEGERSFTVRVTENLEVAQAFRLAEGDTPGEGRRLLAVWLQLPAVPSSEQRADLYLTEATGDPPVPSPEPIVRMEATLPADGSAYIQAGGGYWFRAAFPKPIELDGARALRPLFVAVSGRGEGTVLSHRSDGALPGERGRTPSAAMAAGQALVRNRVRTGYWDLQAFDQQAALWLVDLELEPLPTEYGSLIALGVGGLAPQPLALTGAADVRLQVGPLPLARGDSQDLAVMVQSAVSGQIKAQVSLYKPIMPI